MLTIEKWVGMSPKQYEIVIEGMRNPMNSWDKSDSSIEYIENLETLNVADFEFHLGDADKALMIGLGKGGPVNAKYRRMMPIWVTINAPLYWWKEFDTYKVGTVSNSCSTMHKIHAKEFDWDDFSHDQMINTSQCGDFVSDICDCVALTNEEIHDCVFSGQDSFQAVINALNVYRNAYLKCVSRLKFDKDLTNAERCHLQAQAKRFWYQMIQHLPSSYMQKRTIFISYEVLHNIYIWRRNHKLVEWHVFCDWIMSLPYSDVITLTDFEKGMRDNGPKWRPISEYDPAKHDWVLLRCFMNDGISTRNTELLPIIAEMREDGKWHHQVNYHDDNDILDLRDIEIVGFFDMTDIVGKDEGSD